MTRLRAPLGFSMRVSIRTASDDSRCSCNMQWAAVDMPDPETPVGARGVGEPPLLCRLCWSLNSFRMRWETRSFAPWRPSTRTPSDFARTRRPMQASFDGGTFVETRKAESVAEFERLSGICVAGSPSSIADAQKLLGSRRRRLGFWLKAGQLDWLRTRIKKPRWWSTSRCVIAELKGIRATSYGSRSER